MTWMLPIGNFPSAEHRKYAVVGVFDVESGRVRFYQLVTMPFGSIMSVYSFLRVAASLNHIGCSLLHIPFTSYFDDFSVVATPQMAHATDLLVKSLFDLLGIESSFF